MKGPGVPAGRESAVVSTTSIAPTIQSLLGLSIPSTTQAPALLPTKPEVSWVPSETRAFAHPHYGWKDLVLVLRNDRLACLVEPTRERIEISDRAAQESSWTPTQGGADHDACAAGARTYLALPTMTRAWIDRLPPERIEALRALGYVH
jgi:arylsulfatase A-like enzyme